MLTTSGIDVAGTSDEDTFGKYGSKVGSEAASHMPAGIDGVGAVLGECCMTSLEKHFGMTVEKILALLVNAPVKFVNSIMVEVVVSGISRSIVHLSPPDVVGTKLGDLAST